MLRLQAPLPDDYTLASPDELVERIAAAKATLGDAAADPRPPLPARRGDPLGRRRRRLVQARPLRRGQRPGDRHRVLRRALHGRVGRRAHRPTTSASILPDLNAGCSMADMADIDQVEEAWDEIAGVTAIDRVVPITYMNSSAALKAFVGRHGGAVCTSSNARAVLEWALATRRQGAVLPRPAPRPQHRLRDGLHRSRHARVEPAPRSRRARGARRQGRDVPALEGPLLRAPALPARARRRGPRRASRRRDRSCTPSARTRSSSSPTGSARPSASRNGSQDAPGGHGDRPSAPRSTWCSASPPSTPTRRSSRSTRSICPCSTMFRIDGPHLAWVLEYAGARRGRESDRRRRRHDAEWARVALQRMLDIT